MYNDAVGSKGGEFDTLMSTKLTDVAVLSSHGGTDSIVIHVCTLSQRFYMYLLSTCLQVQIVQELFFIFAFNVGSFAPSSSFMCGV